MGHPCRSTVQKLGLPWYFRDWDSVEWEHGFLARGFFHVETMRNRNNDETNAGRFWAASREPLCNPPRSIQPLRTWAPWVHPSRGAQSRAHPTEPQNSGVTPIWVPHGVPTADPVPYPPGAASLLPASSPTTKKSHSAQPGIKCRFLFFNGT